MPLLRPRWVLLHFLVLVIAGTCVALGLWQLERLSARRAHNAVLEARLGEPTEALESLLGRYQTDLPADAPRSALYRPVVAEGEYVPAEEVLLRTAGSLEGRPGYDILTPLRLDDGRAVLVARGWVPFELNEPPIQPALPPEGRVTVTGVLHPAQRPPEGAFAGLAPRDPPGELAITAWADPERLGEQMPFELLPVVLELRAQQPPQAGELPIVVPEPPRTDGPHLGYAVQWFSFAALAALIYGFVLRGVLRGSRPANRP